MSQFIVITTVQSKTPAVALFERLPDWELILVGDRKSAPIEQTGRLTFLSLEVQLGLGLNTGAASPCNHYARKNVGYLHAMREGARVIYDTDDDNFPDPGLRAPPAFRCDREAGGAAKFVNIYRHFSDEHVWPRGFPLDEIRKADRPAVTPARRNVGVWQGLVNEDPDVDAVWRLVMNKRIVFNPGDPVCIEAGTYCPFNSQNTFWCREVFPLLYLPTTVRFRFTDILRSYVAQRLMWENGRHVGFMTSSVYQERNPHDYLDDFKDEIDCYLHVKPITALLDSLTLSGDYHRDLRTAYAALQDHGYVTENELYTLDAWLNDLAAIEG